MATRTGHNHENAHPAAADKVVAQNGSAPAAANQPSDVEQAFALGWHVAEAFHMEDDAGAPLIPGDVLSQINNLDFDKRAQLLMAQINAGVSDLNVPQDSRLATLTSAAGSFKVTTVNVPPGKDGASLAELNAVHEGLLETLTARDFRLGKAYAVGVALGETIVLGYRHLLSKDTAAQDVAQGAEYVKELFYAERIESMTRNLRDLKTAFDDHATDAVVATLQDWSDTLATWNDPGAAPDKRQKVAKNFYHQGSIWRALLSGEKKAVDYLTVADYAKAIGDLLKNYTKMAAQFGATWTNAITFLVLAAVVIGAGLFIGLVLHGGVEGLYTAVIGLLSVFGVTAASIIAAVKNALNAAGNELWKVELSAAIAESIAWVPVKLQTSNAVVLRKGFGDTRVVFDVSRRRSAIKQK